MYLELHRLHAFINAYITSTINVHIILSGARKNLELYWYINTVHTFLENKFETLPRLPK